MHKTIKQVKLNQYLSSDSGYYTCIKTGANLLFCHYLQSAFKKSKSKQNNASLINMKHKQLPDHLFSSSRLPNIISQTAVQLLFKLFEECFNLVLQPHQNGCLIIPLDVSSLSYFQSWPFTHLTCPSL